MFNWVEIIVFIVVLVFVIQYFKRKLVLSSGLVEGIKKENIALQQSIVELSSELQTLRQSSNLTDRIALICKQSPNAIMLMDERGNIDWVNRGFELMYEYNFHEFTNALGFNIRQTSFNPAIEERLQRCSRGEIVQYDALNVTRSGKSVWTRTALIPIFDDCNKLISMVTIDTDIHRLKLASDQLVESTIDLQNQLQKIALKFSSLALLTTRLFEAIEESHYIFNETDKIAHFIQEVSIQTKILGLNALIEAQRSGVVGAGFSVVADEIVRVSQTTKSSALKINSILNTLKTDSLHVNEEKAVIELGMREHQQLIDEITNEIQDIEELIEIVRAD